MVAVGAALESDEPSVVDGAVDEGGGHVLVTQDASPSGDFDVGDVDDAPSTDNVRIPAHFRFCSSLRC